VINWTELAATKEEKKTEWTASGSTKFVLFESFLLDGICELLRDFSAIHERSAAPQLRKHKHVRGKVGARDRSSMSEAQRKFFDEVNSPRFVRHLTDITGIAPIYPDSELFGGGLHETRRGGFLNVHTDFNHHPKTGKHRRLNLILYLNPNWHDEWNGQIELWDHSVSRTLLKANPTMNRALLFETSETSYHGHPSPLETPPHVRRQSLAVYYYSEWPEGVSKRDATGYELTRSQWASLMCKIADHLSDPAADEDGVVEKLALEYQTGDIRHAYRALTALRSAPLTNEQYWEYPDGTISLKERVPLEQDDDKELTFTH